MKNELEMDVRLLRRNLSKGLISQAAVDKKTATLPDLAERAEWIDYEKPEGEAPAEGEG